MWGAKLYYKAELLKNKENFNVLSEYMESDSKTGKTS